MSEVRELLFRRSPSEARRHTLRNPLSAEAQESTGFVVYTPLKGAVADCGILEGHPDSVIGTDYARRYSRDDI